jgi:hypothetical protein
MEAQTFLPNFTVYYSIEGLFFDCFQFESLLVSSLSCFYSIKCLNGLLNAMPLSDESSANAWSNRSFIFNRLNDSLSRFSANETLEKVAQSMFIDR